MAIFDRAPQVEYTNKTFLVVVLEIIASVKARFPGILTDFSSQNVMTMFIEVIAYLVEKISYSINVVAREMFITTAKARSSVLNIIESFGYEPGGRVAATTIARFTLGVDSAYDLIIAAGTIVETADSNPSSFRVLEDATIPAGSAGDYVDVYVENSFEFTEVFTATGGANEEFITSTKNVLLSGIDGSGVATEVLSVTVGSIPFTAVETLEDSNPTSQHVRVILENGGRIRLRFGDGTNGIRATGTVVLEGRYGGGSAANGARITKAPSFQNVNGEVISVSVYNSVVTAGGADEETLAEIKENAPAYLRSGDRTVSQDDFANNSQAVTGVDRAAAFTADDDPLIQQNKTEVVVLPSSFTNAQLTGIAVIGPTTTDGVDDVVRISINGETPQDFDLGNQADGPAIATALQAAIRAASPEYDLDNVDAYADFTVEWDAANTRFILTNGQAGPESSIEILVGTPDAGVPLGLSAGTVENGIYPSAGTKAAVLTEVTITKPCCSGHNVEVFGPDAKQIYIDMRVNFPSTYSSQEKISLRNSIREAVATYFQPRLDSGYVNPDVDFGETIWISDMMAIVNGVTGVISVDEDNFKLNGTYEEITLDSREFPVLGGIIVRDLLGNEI